MGDVGQYSSIDVSDRGAIYISYFDATNSCPRVAVDDGGLGSWSTPSVQSTSAAPEVAGQYTAISESAGVGDGYCSSIYANGMTIYISHFAITDFGACGGKIDVEKSIDSGYGWTSNLVDSEPVLFWGMENFGFTSLDVDGSNLFLSYCANHTVGYVTTDNV